MTVIVVGMGRMGKAVAELLRSKYRVVCGDTLDEIKSSIGLWDTVFACVPYHAVVEVAQYAAEHGANYVDLTEDIGAREQIREIAGRYPMQLFISGTGLAPGYINMIAGQLERRIVHPLSVEMVCGALPQDQYCNPLGYQISWSPSGLLREYTAPCEVKINGVVEECPALGGFIPEQFPSWPPFETFYTSGGAGTACYTLCAEDVSYRTLRYLDHLRLIRPLVSGPDPEQRILDACGELVGEDVVYIFVRVRSKEGDISYQERILPQLGLTAIQYATAMGAIRTWKAALGRTGFVRPEEL